MSNPTKNGTLWIKEVLHRVGINKKNPKYTLDILGDLYFTGSLSQNGNVLSEYWYSGSNNSIYYIGGYVGINTSNPNDYLNVNGNINTSNYYLINNSLIISSTNLSNSILYSNLNTLGVLEYLNIVNNLIVDNNLLYVDSIKKKVGINTNSPLVDLDVNGNVNLSNNLFVDNIINTNKLYVSSSLITYGNTEFNINRNYYTIFGNNSNNKVGINTNNPLAELDVNGNAKISKNLTIGSNIDCLNYVNTINLDVSSYANINNYIFTNNLIISDNATIIGNLYVEYNLISNSDIYCDSTIVSNAIIARNVIYINEIYVSGNVYAYGSNISYFGANVIGGTNADDIISYSNANIINNVNTNNNIVNNMIINYGNTNLCNNANTYLIIGNNNTKVGINIETPIYELDIKGSANITGNINSPNILSNIIISSSFISNISNINGILIVENSAIIKGQTYLGTNPNTNIIMGSNLNNKVGINNYDPQYEFDANGITKINNSIY